MTLKGSCPVREGGVGVVGIPTPGLLPHVGVWESHAHQDEDCRRRPPAFGKTGPKVLSERASCPPGITVEAEEMGRDASGMCPEIDQRGRAGCGGSRQSGSAGGMGRRTVR